MFVWTSIAHMALPLGEAGINEIPNKPVVLGAMQSSIGDKQKTYLVNRRELANSLLKIEMDLEKEIG